MKAGDVEKRLRELADSDKAKVLQGFFKTGPGQYGEGDIFLGVTVPKSRKVAKEFKDLSFVEIRKLLMSPIHEVRLVAILLLVHLFQKGGGKEQKKIYDFYMKHTRQINNWDLVDLSALYIAGAHLFDRDRKPLYELARSDDLWERRIAIISTFYFIRQGSFSDTLAISKILLNDEHDLIHKAVGWMLREVGKRDMKCEESFLKEHYRNMPRTMLRYAIEKFPEAKRQRYLKGTIK